LSIAALHTRFFSLATLNARIAELLENLNTLPMRLYRTSRREVFAPRRRVPASESRLGP
jgi:hypothetical protein